MPIFFVSEKPLNAPLESTSMAFATSEVRYATRRNNATPHNAIAAPGTSPQRHAHTGTVTKRKAKGIFFSHFAKKKVHIIKYVKKNAYICTVFLSVKRFYLNRHKYDYK